MKRMEPLNQQELVSLMSAAKKHSLRDWALLVTIYSHGLRASEAGGLLRANLDDKSWTLYIKRIKGSNATTDAVYPHSEKLLDERKALTEWLAARPKTSAYLFPDRQGSDLSRISVYKILKMHAKTAGIPSHKAAPHALRHSLGQHCHDSGVSIEKTAAILGHKSIESTRQYYRTSQEEANQSRRLALAYQG